jgi:hypothetical protein
VADTDAPDPLEVGSTIDIEGAYRYPLPLSVTTILVNIPAVTVAVAVA